MTDPQDEAMYDVHALSGAYAIDALDPEERLLFEAHLRRCPTCQAEVDSLRETGAAMSADAATNPPDTLRDSVLAGIETVRPAPPLTAPGPEPLHHRRRRIRGLGGTPLLMAAAVVLIAVVGLTWWQPWWDSNAPAPTAAERVMTATDATRTTQTFSGGAKATLVLSRSEGKAVIVTDDMAPPPQGKVYELWLQSPEGDMLPAGLMPKAPDATVVLDGDASSATGVGITVEPEGGSRAPTSEPIALFEFEDG